MKAGALREGVQRPGHCRGVGLPRSQFARRAQGERDALPWVSAGRSGRDSMHLPSLGVSSLKLDGLRPVLFSSSLSDAETTIRTARAICKQGQLQGVIVIGIDDKGIVGGASYGATVRQCKQLAPWLEDIVDNAGVAHDLGEFSHPPDQTEER